MRIVFITGCLEPGRDGVGDYTRTLANACRDIGHETMIISVADRQSNIESSGRILRLRFAEWRSSRRKQAVEWLRQMAPDWASLQFVPYGFQPRGLFSNSVEPLAELMSVTPQRHIFFHELWIGSFEGAPFKARFYGALQRRAVRKLLHNVQPRLVHTSTGYYQAALAAIGQPASRLRMFGSIPVHGPSLETTDRREDAIACVHFGTMHPNWEANAFFQELANLGERNRKRPRFLACGSLGYGTAFLKRLEATWHRRIDFVTVGFQPATELSQVFASCDFAVTSVPWNTVGKSSSAATLREHGLKVVVTAAGAPPRFTSAIVDDALEDSGFVAFFRTPVLTLPMLAKTPARATVGSVAAKFLEDLTRA